jgi:plastocyanin
MVAGAAFIGCSAKDAPTTAPPNGSVADVYTIGSVFSPFTTEIEAGGTVRFHITLAPDGFGHNALFDGAAGAPADINIVADTTVSRIFATPGTYQYVCTVHPGMAGEIVVH